MSKLNIEPTISAMFAENQDIRKMLLDESMSSRKLANILGRNESSVRRWRAKHAQLRDNIGNPYGNDTKLSESMRRERRVPAWVPGIDIGKDDGEFRTLPIAVPSAGVTPEPEETELLREFDLDPAVWEITSARKSQWQSAAGDWLEARKVSFRRRGAAGHGISSDEVERILSPYQAQRLVYHPAEDAPYLVIPAGDLQLGKQDGGGTSATVERFARITDTVASDLAKKEYKGILLPWMGDCIEGIVSQNGRLMAGLDISVTEQVRIYRRLMMHQIATLAPLAPRVLIPVVPGNHDETTRVQQMPILDSWAIEGAIAVRDWMDGRPEYEHVQFIFPEQGEAGVTVDVGGTVLAFIHGHTTGANPNRVLTWWKGQAHGRQLAGEADILFSAHWHHLRVEATGGNRTWIQIPALDGGSEWFRRKTGDEPDAGILSVEITPGQGAGWRNLIVYS